jgi:Carboxypeptidase regulatory-like domain
MKRSPIRAALALALAIGAFSTASAQFSGSISGTIQDPAGAAVPGATVTLTNVGTGEGKAGTSDAQGFYQFVSLAPGNYAVKTSAKGFADSQQSFSLETNQTLNLPVKLTVGTSSETIQVTTQAPLLDTCRRRSPLRRSLRFRSPGAI